MINKLLLALLLCSLGSNLLGQNLGGNQRRLRDQQGFNPVSEGIEPNANTPPDVNLLSQEKANLYQEILSIDDFQKEVLKMFLHDYYTKSSSIAFDQNLQLDEKQDKISIEKESLKKKLLEVFPEEQVEAIMKEEKSGSKYQELKKEKKGLEKAKKRKKRKAKRNN